MGWQAFASRSPLGPAVETQKRKKPSQVLTYQAALPYSEQVTSAPHLQGAIQRPPPITEPSSLPDPVRRPQPWPQPPRTADRGPPRALSRPGTLEVSAGPRPTLGQHPIEGAVSMTPGTRGDKRRMLIGRRPFRHSQRTLSLLPEGCPCPQVPLPVFPKSPVASVPERPRCGVRL